MRRSGVWLICLLLTAAVFGFSKTKKPKKTERNPPQYEVFSHPIGEQERYLHALDRLTFGPRPGDLDDIKKLGIERWLDAQLHPERLPENPDLAQRLDPYESVRLSIYDTWTHYPAPQMIAAVAHGRQAPPDDPRLRALVLHLADRYLKKHEGPGAADAGVTENAQQFPDLDQKMKLSDVLTAQQIETLHSGKPDEKHKMVSDLPPEKWMDFAWALAPRERQQLYVLAPVELRRTLMLTLNPSNVVASDLSEARLLRAIYSTHQLEELMVDFWYNHFNVYINKGADRFLVPTYEREAIRPYVFGKFYDLLLATAKSPAMLFYLDNAESVGQDTPAAAKGKRGLNENYGRELMELHTLGVDGGYTQKDVIDVARCFTGWTVAPPRRGGGFEYNGKMHDKGEKIVLGHVIPAGGDMEDGLQVLDILAHHPSTARFISRELAQRFVADDPPPSLVNRMAQTFVTRDGDIREVMRTMIESPEFWSQGAFRAKVKTPLELVASAARALDVSIDSPFPLLGEMQRLGEPLYRKIEPTGYENANEEWISSSALLERMNFGLALARNNMPGLQTDTVRLQNLARRDPLDIARTLLDGEPSYATRAAIAEALKSESPARPPDMAALVAGLVVGSPDFQRR